MMRCFWLLAVMMGGVFAQGAEALVRREWVVDGVAREALVHVPKVGKEGALIPVIFGFHGHGGTMGFAARGFALEALWPEALVIYPQGLNTPGRLTDPEGKRPGWQSGPGEQGDRDLKFFDAMLSSLKKDYAVDERRVFAMGHSNGGSFTYLLWAMRGETLAAVAPSGTAAPLLLGRLRAKPVLHVAGEGDPLVRYAWQKATIEAVVKINQCGAGRAWAEDANCTFYPSAVGAPVVTAIHPGGHEFPKGAPGVMVKFFKGVAAKKEEAPRGR